MGRDGWHEQQETQQEQEQQQEQQQEQEEEEEQDTALFLHRFWGFNQLVKKITEKLTNWIKTN